MRIDLLAGFLLLIVTAAAMVAVIELPEGREFSAEVVDLDSPERSGRIYAGKRKLRLESSSGGSTTVTIYDLDRKTMHLLDPQAETYFKFPFPVGEFQNGDFYTHSRDEPCGSGYRATKVGSEAVDGRLAEKWLCEVTELPKYMADKKKEDLRLVFVIDPWHVWYDLEHSLMVRYEHHDGDGQELRNVRLEPQPDELFVVPPGYMKDKSPFARVLGSAAQP